MGKPFQIKTDDKPNLAKALEENPKLAAEVIGTFVSMMEEAFKKENGLTWAEIPKKLHRDLNFSSLVGGILHGSLDLKEINPEAYDALTIEVHPLAILSPRKNYIDGGIRLTNWREHFKLQPDVPVDAETIATIFRKMLRYSKYIKFEELQRALEANQITTYRGLGDEQIAKLPMYPALRYQRSVFGDLHVGKFFDDVGALDGGTVVTEPDECPACQRKHLETVGRYRICTDCSLGVKVEDL